MKVRKKMKIELSVFKIDNRLNLEKNRIEKLLDIESNFIKYFNTVYCNDMLHLRDILKHYSENFFFRYEKINTINNVTHYFIYIQYSQYEKSESEKFNDKYNFKF